MSGDPVESCINALLAQEKLPETYRALIRCFWRPLAEKIAAWRRMAGRPIIVGVNGGQGAGKTTLCIFLEQCLLPELGVKVATVSLDDFYLPKAQRMALAETVHPLLAIRGVPGTHDVAELMKVLRALKSGAPAELPVFDKSCDDRAPASRRVEGGVDVILFEGWCVGAAPQSEEALAAPVNALECEEDQNGAWRCYVNKRLGSDYQAVFALIDRLVMLRAPDMAAILENRREQERKLRAKAPLGEAVMNDEEVARFVQFYERITRHMLAEMPSRADIVLEIAELRRIQESGRNAG